MKTDCPVEFIVDFGGEESFEVGKKHQGQLFVKPKFDVTVQEIGFRLEVETRGSLHHSRKIISDTQLTDSIELRSGTRYPFDIILFNDFSPTYKGKNVSLSLIHI